jgi:hypothetical protein
MSNNLTHCKILDFPDAYFHLILTAFNKSKIMSEVAHDSWKRLKTIHRFHKLAFDRGDSSLECFNRSTQNYGSSQFKFWTVAQDNLTSQIMANVVIYTMW